MSLRGFSAPDRSARRSGTSLCMPSGPPQTKRARRISGALFGKTTSGGLDLLAGLTEILLALTHRKEICAVAVPWLPTCRMPRPTKPLVFARATNAAPVSPNAKSEKLTLRKLLPLVTNLAAETEVIFAMGHLSDGRVGVDPQHYTLILRANTSSCQQLLIGYL
jgi:hypothetical protein